jgi:hypothetical protein
MVSTAPMGHSFRLDHVGKRQFDNLFAANLARPDEAGGELAADHTGGADNQNMHTKPSVDELIWMEVALKRSEDTE